MKFLLSALLILFSFTLSAQWESTTFSGIHEGVAAFDSNTFGMIEATGVKFTSNGGDNFTEGDLLNTDGLEISGFIPTDLEYYDENTLFCTGYFITNQFEGILKSTNGGFNWEYVHQASSIEPDLQLNDLHIASNGDIYAVGKLGKVLKSEDEGETWVAQFIGGAGDLFQVFALDANRVSVGGVGGLFTSSNGGVIWDNEPSSDPITGISYKDANVIMACTADDEILLSTNGGIQWSTQAFDFVNLVDVTHFSGDTWFLGSSTELYRSDDNGTSWFIQPTLLSFVPLYQLKHRNGLLIGRRQNRVLYTSEPTPIPSNYVVMNAVNPPEAACGGVLNFTIDVDNRGSNEITDLLIDFSVDGEFQTSIEWSGSIPSQTSNFLLEVDVNTGITTTEQLFEFQISEVNESSNLYPNEGNQEIDYSSAGIQGTIVIGPTGDFSSLSAFNETVNNPDLCGDLVIQFENGTYSGDQINLGSLSYQLIIEAQDELSPDVTILDGFTVNGDNSEGSHLIFRNINTSSTESFVDPVQLSGFNQIDISNLTSSTSEGGNQDCIEINSDLVFIENSSFTGGTSGIRFNGGENASMNVQNCSFSNNTNGIFIWDENDSIVVNQCSFDIGNQALKINIAEYVVFSNNTCRGSNSLATMVEADTNESDGIGPRIQYFNNVIEHNHPQMLVGRGSARVMNNVFIRVGTENNFSPAVIIQNNTQADIQIKNNIFQMGNSLLGSMVNSNILNQNPGIIDYNVYYSIADSPFGITNPGQFDTLEEHFEYWQEVRDQDINSVIIEVDFELESFGKPLLNENNSGLVDVSPVPGPELDIAGNFRSLPNDLGAYELQSSSLDANLVEIITESDCVGNATFSARISNASPTNITQLRVSWSIDGVSQEEIQWQGLLEPSSNEVIELGSLFFEGAQSMELSAQIEEVNNGEEEPTANNQSSLAYATYSGSAVLSVGEDQDFASFEEAMLVLTEEGMCGNQEIILQPGIYTPQQHEYHISNPQNYTLTLKSSTLNADDVNLDFGEQVWTLSGLKNLHLEHLSVNSNSDSLLIIPEAMDSLIADHCMFGGKLFIDEPFNAESLPVIHFTHNTFNGSLENGFENSGNSGILEFVFTDNVIENNFFNTWNLNCQKVEYAEIKRNDINTFSFVGINLSECREAVISENQLSYRFGAAVQYTCPEEGTSSLIFENNFTETSVSGGRTLLFTGEGLEQSTLYFHHNTSRNGAQTLQVGDAQSFIYNNIFTATQNAIQLNTLASTSTQIDGNIYSMESSVPPVAINLDMYGLSDWQLEFGQDENSVQQEVTFAMAEGYLTEDPIVDGLQNGVAIGGIVASDIEGNNRDENTPDAGCYEFGEIPVLSGLALISLEGGEPMCGTQYDASITVSNIGQEAVTSFSYSIVIDDYHYEGSWEGNLEANQEVLVPIENFYPPISSIIVADVFITSIDGESEGISSVDLEAAELTGQDLSGLVIIGNSPDAQFNQPQELIDFLMDVGICGDIQAYLQVGDYDDLEINQLDLNGFQLEFQALLQDNSGVIIGSENAINSTSSDGIRFKNLSFQSSANGISISNSTSAGRFENCVFTGGASAGLLLVQSDSYEIQNCEIDRPIEIIESSNCSIEACELTSNLRIEDARNTSIIGNQLLGENGSSEQPGMISLHGDLGITQVSNNLVSSNITSALYISNCDCDPNEFVEITNNLFIASNEMHAVETENATRLALIYNTLQSESGIALSLLESTDIQVINNALVSEFANSADFTGSVDLIAIRNNLFYSGATNEVGAYPNVDDLNADTNTDSSENVALDPMLDANGYYITNEDALGLALALTDYPDDFYGDFRSTETPTFGAIETSFESNAPGDFNGDGQVGAADLLVLLSNIGCTGDCGPADMDGDGVVGIGDLLILLALI